MPNITEITDSKSPWADKTSEPMPSVAEMRESQRKGSVGTGTQSDDYGDMEADFNIGTGK